MILVTGASGFIGRSLLLALSDAERPVKAYRGRINDPLSLRAELLDVDTVFHLAGSETRDRVRLLKHVDVEGTERLLEECRRARVERFILVSRLNADPHSLYPLLKAKGQQERLILDSGIPYTILRSATLFGKEDRFLNVISALAAWSWPFVWLPGGGRVAMQPLWVEDLVRCLMLCLERNDLVNQTLEVGGEERLHYAAIVRHVLAMTGTRRIPLGFGVKLMRPISAVLFGWWPRPPVTRFFLDRFSVPEVVALDSVNRQFGFRPARLAGHTAYLRPRPGWRLARLR
jgi:uncharacterized protein YbjT (DUF2867 family)